jgi:hypothetical protein
MFHKGFEEKDDAMMMMIMMALMMMMLFKIYNLHTPPHPSLEFGPP